MSRRRPDPVLITDAPESPERERLGREVRYLIMMGIRAACLIVAAILVSNKPPHYGWWVIGCVVGMVVLPWLAVLIANDRPAKARYRMSRYLHRPAAPPPTDPRSLPTPREDRVIDADD
ncbi:hypothetical protein GCM10009682_50610 [Luedemannella flava]|uniref:DUF3099 domain-containing protein n=1 Tax=Luedemannella flava TaxID=349316 RepID=A0ABN2MFU0_9ACTN